MKIVGISRRDLIDWPSARHAGSHEYDASRSLDFAAGELVCVYEESEQQIWPFPRLIAVPSGRVRDFLAWAATYLPFRPITAFARVVDRSRFLPVVRPLVASRTLKLAIAGAVLGEALQNDTERDVPAARVLSDALMTNSFVFARALARGVFPLVVSDAANVGARLRILFDDDLSISVIQRMWSRIAGVIDRAEVQFHLEPREEARRMQGSLLADTKWDLPIGEFIDGDSPRSANREARVRQFEQVTANIMHSRGNVAELGMLQAVLADRIAPGSFEHASLLRTTISKESAALAWYGFFAGMNPSSKIGSFAGGVVWRLAEAIFEDEDVVGRTRADVSLDELEILSGFAEPRAAVTPRVGSALCVEVLPTVYAYRKWTSSDVEPELHSDRLSELGLALAEANAAYSALVADQRKPVRRPSKRKR